MNQAFASFAFYYFIKIYYCPSQANQVQMKKIINYHIINPEIGRVQILPLFTLTPQERLNGKMPL